MTLEEAENAAFAKGRKVWKAWRDAYEAARRMHGIETSMKMANEAIAQMKGRRR